MNIINIEERNRDLRALLEDTLTVAKTLADACEQDMQKARHRAGVRAQHDDLRVFVGELQDFLAEHPVDDWEEEA